MTLELWWLPLLPAVATAVIDMRSRRIPNVIVLPALALGLTIGWWQEETWLAIAGMMLAAATGLGVRYAARGGFGLGDVKLLAYGGAVVGVGGLPGLLLGTAVSGGALGLVYWGRRGRSATVPYGVAITLGLGVALLTVHRAGPLP